MTDDYTGIVREFLRGPNAEALAWLDSVDTRTLGELRSHDQSVTLVNQLYSLGAEAVLAVGLDPERDNGCRYLLVQLPVRDSHRDAIFAFERSGVEEHGFDGTPDDGQEYLFIDVKNFG